MRSGFATGIQVISNSSEDVDFYIHELYPIHFFGTTVYITTTHVCTFIVLLVIAILAICARRSVLKTRDNPSKFATGVELAIESLPINVISEFATPVSLSLRLFGNILAGTVMMALYYGMLPIFVKIGIPSALHVYFDLFSGVIQAYVFCMLTMTFVANKRNVEG